MSLASEDGAVTGNAIQESTPAPEESVDRSEVVSEPPLGHDPIDLLEAAARAACTRLVVSVEGDTCRALGFRAEGSSKPVVLGGGEADRGRRLLNTVLAEADLPTGRPEHPLQGALTTSVLGRSLDYEITVVPTLRGQQVAIEVRTEESGIRTLDDLGLPPGDHARLRALLTSRSGLLVIAGNAGHGKSTVRSAALEALAASGRRVLSVERSVGTPRRNVTYVRLPECATRPEEEWIAAALRLRPEVAAFDDLHGVDACVRAVRAALQGTLVLYAMQQEDVVSAARYLESLPLAPGTIAATLLGILAVRLVRRTCPGCAVESPLPIELTAAVELLGGPRDGHYVHGAGCEECAHTGSHGLMPLYELVSLDDHTRLRLVESRNENDLVTYLAEARPDSIHAQAARLAAEGKIPVSELARVL